MNTSLTRKIIFPLLLLLALYTGVMVMVQQRLEKQTRKEILQAELSTQVELIHQAYIHHQLDSLLPLLSPNLRVTIIANEGQVVADSQVQNVGKMENHETRPELQQARFHKKGIAQRVSASTGQNTYYLARYYGTHYVRTALPVASVRGNYKLEATNYYIYVSLVVFIIMVVLLLYFASRYQKSIKRLNNLSKEIANGTPFHELQIPSGEMGVISKQILDLFKEKEEAIEGIQEARERLILHFRMARVGIALFNHDGEVEFANHHFIQYANMLTTGSMTDASELLNEPALLPVKQFLLQEHNRPEENFALTLHQSNRIFAVKALKSHDGSFELTIEDVTEEEKNRVLKQEMTSNITHEIRTPLTSILGFLETLNFQDLSPEKRKEFTQKAYNQALRMSEMMDDIRLLSKLDEDNRSFGFAPTNLHQLAEEIRVAYTAQFAEHKVIFHNEIDQDATVNGSQSLLYSVLQNLVENSLRYAGDNIEIVIKSYHQDANYVYLSYHDTGRGVSDANLARLFERFYRVDDGRTRNQGGSGLGLSIVRNAIHLHGGQVQARNHSTGGLEILFHLKK